MVIIKNTIIPIINIAVNELNIGWYIQQIGVSK